MKKDSPLMIACRNGDLETVKQILSKYPNEIDKKNKYDLTPLAVAILNNRLEVVKELLKNGASTSVWCKNKDILKICVAPKHNYNESTSQLTRRDYWKIKDIWTNDKITNKFEEINRLFPLDLKYKEYNENSFKILEEVIKHRINDRLVNYCLLYTLGLGKYHEDLIRESLIKGNYSCLDKTDKDGNTFLIHAAKHGHLSVVKELIKMGFSKTHKNVFGNDALTYATRNGHTEVVNELFN